MCYKNSEALFYVKLWAKLIAKITRLICGGHGTFLEANQLHVGDRYFGWGR